MKLARFRIRLGLPLLGKELIEQAARKRTYVVRFVYACLLFVTAFLFFHDTLDIGSTDPFAVLGRGRQMFDVLVALQFVGVYLFMPAITCGVITIEKERNSLPLLLLTKLGPWTILAEKLLSRLVPMFSFLLLSLPLLAFAYSLGGISQEYLWGGIWTLAISTLQVGTLALLCSTFFRTTSAAFIWTYLLGIAMFFLPPFLAETGFIPLFMLEIIGSIFGWNQRSPETAFLLFGPFVFFESGGSDSFWMLLWRSVPILMTTGTFFVMARLVFLWRAFAPPRNIVMNVFKVLDRVFLKLNNNRVTKGIVLIGDKSALPDGEPVAWRETTKRSLGTARYLFRVFIGLEGPLAFILLLIATAGADSDIQGVSLMLFLLWFIAILMVSVKSAGLIASERSNQTLDVLCTTPMRGRDIIQQKFRGVRRLMIVLLIPFFTVFLFEFWWKLGIGDWRYSMYGRVGFDPVLYLVTSALSVGIYLPMIAWLSLLVGIALKTHTRAIIGALGIIVGWCIGPLVFVMLPLTLIFDARPDSGIIFFTLLSPATIPFMNEILEMDEFAHTPWVAVILNFLLYGTCLVVFRTACLTFADRLLGRSSNKLPEGTPIRHAPVAAA